MLMIIFLFNPEHLIENCGNVLCVGAALEDGMEIADSPKWGSSFTDGTYVLDSIT